MAQENKDANGGIKKIQFCPYCGSKLSADSRFCSNCGASVVIDSQEEIMTTNVIANGETLQEGHAESNSPIKEDTETINETSLSQNINERKVVYEGKIYKCPSCGQPLESFVIKCPYCGYEIRGAKSESSVQELSTKLGDISAKKMQSTNNQKSEGKRESAKTAKQREKAEAHAQYEFEEQIESEKESLITNFVIPNTKEDILEFVILASSNIKSQNYGDTAWISKLEQAYQKAEVSLKGQPELDQIRHIYEKTMRGVNVHKLFLPIFLISMFDLMFFASGIVATMNGGSPLMLIASILVFVLLAAFGLFLYRYCNS